MRLRRALYWVLGWQGAVDWDGQKLYSSGVCVWCCSSLVSSAWGEDMLVVLGVSQINNSSCSLRGGGGGLKPGGRQPVPVMAPTVIGTPF